MIEGNQKKPVITYPCEWAYTVIGSKQEDIHQAVKEVFQERPCTVIPSKTSKGGSYYSLRVEAEVYSDQDRTDLFRGLSLHGSIKIVL